MTAITKIDRASHRQISEKMVAALAALSKELGVTFTAGGGQYSDAGTGTFKINVSVNDNGAGVAGDEEEFRRMAGLDRIDPDAFGRTFYYKRAPYKISGAKPTAPTYRYRAENERTGKTYFFPAETIRQAFPAKSVAA